MNKETGINIDLDIDIELSNDKDKPVEVNASSNNERERDSISFDERSLIEEFLKKKSIKKCPTAYANGALHSHLDY